LEYICAGFSGLWIESHEHDDALQEIATLCRQEAWRLGVWDVDRGLQLRGQGENASSEAESADPLAAIRAVSAWASPESSAILVLVNFHRFLQSAEIVQALARQIVAGKQNRTFVIILAPLVQIPLELEKLFLVLEHELPSREQLEEIARGIATEDGELPGGEELNTVLEAAGGLTRYEAEAAFSLSLVRDKRIVPEAVWELKCQTLKKSGLLTLHRGRETFADLGGMEALKGFCLRALRPRGRRDPLARPRGVLLLSPPGCGKSQFCKALGREVQRPTLCMDIGSLMGSLVGATEANIRRALTIADAMAPSILFLDEIEKGLSGATSTATTDSGVSSRLFGTFLSWLNDHESEVFVVATSNDISRLPPEFSRSERFDGVFFLDLPGGPQKRAIWRMYLEKFGLERNQPLPADVDWTGAEIRSCCRLARLLDVSLLEAAQNVVPVARTSQESVRKLREWAVGRCLSAETSGIFQLSTNSLPIKPGRKVRRDPSNN
jgi:hypothetical protein